MRIAQVAPPLLEVPPHTYGGIEYVVSLLTEELLTKGHDVTLFATGDSKTEATLVPVWNKGLLKDATVKDHLAVYGILAKELLERQHEFDVIHDHTEAYLRAFDDFLSPPVVNTLHYPLSEEKIILYKKSPRTNYVAISNNQRKTAPGLHIVKTIYNGIPVERYEMNGEPEDYIVWISNIAPNKGLAEAVEIAKRAGERLLVAGPIFPQNANYFEYRIKPLIDGKQIQFVGMADFEKKVELFKNAKAFLFPIFEKPEPFGLVVIEAMACGTPVIAARSGSMPELIEDGKNGFLVDTKEEAVQALRKLDTISRQYCREYVAKTFPAKRMVSQYERLYAKVAEELPAKKRPNPPRRS